ncbi:hypothetical protein JTB14_020112 [Gonioctena quinquepunctata]|nr:hypothetical protein JTB14_020112 [Gonioctena quinquepunctata]
MIDDIVDHSETRGNAPCWYKNKEVGLKAVVDALYVENAVYKVLKTYCSSHPQYLNLLEAFTDLNFEMNVGQSLDLMARDWNKFNMDHYKLVAKGKGGLLFNFVQMALRLTNSSEELHMRIIPIVGDLGYYYQIQVRLETF